MSKVVVKGTHSAPPSFALATSSSLQFMASLERSIVSFFCTLPNSNNGLIHDTQKGDKLNIRAVEQGTNDTIQTTIGQQLPFISHNYIFYVQPSVLLQCLLTMGILP